MKSDYIIPFTIFMLGILLLIYMMVDEGEPGALPLFITMLGIGWFIAIRVRKRNKRRR